MPFPMRRHSYVRAGLALASSVLECTGALGSQGHATERYGVYICMKYVTVRGLTTHITEYQVCYKRFVRTKPLN